MDKILDILHQLQQANAQPLTAQQDLQLTAPQAGQLHRTADFEENPEMFYLITKVNLNQTCDVIPGSLDGLMGGTNDAVISPRVMGAEVILALDLAATIPNDQLGIGFAKFDEKTFAQSCQALKKFQEDPTDQSVLPHALPYFNTYGSRYKYHETMAEVVHRATQSRVLKLNFSDFQPIWPEDITAADSLRCCSLASQISPLIPKPSQIISEVKKLFELAAGNEDDIERTICQVDDNLGYVDITYAAEDGKMRFRFKDSAGEKTTSFDGMQIIDETGKVYATVTNGLAMIHDLKQKLRRCALLDSHQTIHHFRAVK